MRSLFVDLLSLRNRLPIVASTVLQLAYLAGQGRAASDGVVVDRLGRPLGGVTVALSQAGVSTKSDASGRWVLDVSSRVDRSGPVRNVRWENGRLIVDAAREQMAKLSVFDVRGTRIVHDVSMRLGSGKNSIALTEIPTGLACIRIETEEGRGTFLLNSLQRGLVSAKGGYLNALPRTAAIAIDTFRFSLAGRVLANIPSGQDSLFDTLGLDTSLAFPWNPNVQYGQFVDDRDHQIYRTVKIGRQRWMAENLFFKPAESGISWCFDNKPLSCAVHGRLYSAQAVLNGYPGSTRNPSGLRGICPDGWHMPSDSEFQELQAFTGSDSAALVKLFAMGSWEGSEVKAMARDSLGFRAIASGERREGGTFGNPDAFYGLGISATFWNSTDTIGSSTTLGLRWMSPYLSRWGTSRYSGYGYSVRCVEGDTTYPLKLSAPGFGWSSGVHDSTLLVKLFPPYPGATIHCTTDGSAADSTSPACPALMTVDRNMTIRAVATYPGMFTSSEAVRTYVILGRLPDGRDGQVYRTVVIGSQTWMAENLNFDPGADMSSCYENRDKNCLSRGRLYDWKTAMKLPDSCATSICSVLIASKHQGVCPDGWRIPSKEDWSKLMVAAGNDSLVGKRLKSQSYWKNSIQVGARAGTNEYGFDALPGGYQVFNVFIGGPDLNTANISDGTIGVWMSASEQGPSSIGGLYLYSNSDNATLSDAISKTYRVSVRCIKNP